MSQHLTDSTTASPSGEGRGGFDLTAVLGELSTGERVIAGGSLLLLVAMFLNWISVSCSGSICGMGSMGGGAGGLHGGGWLTFLGLLGAAGLLVGRRLLAGRVTLPALPAADAVLYMAAGGVEVAGCLVFWLEYHGALVSDGPFSVGLGVGWFLAGAAGLATVAGGYLLHSRTETTPPAPVA